MTTSITSVSETESKIQVNGLDALTFNSAGNLGVKSINGGQLAGMRNRIINGKMEIAQRGTSFAAIASSAYSLDRWLFGHVGTAVGTISQETFAQGVGLPFLRALFFTVTTADSSIGATEATSIIQRIEGFSVRDLVGVTFTLSFWVRSSKTGVHCVRFGNAGNDRTYVAEYTVTAANVYEYKTVTVVGGIPTSGGTWDFTNGVGLGVQFALAAGTNFHTTANAWQTGNFLATANQVNCLDSNTNIFAITGVQLEVGSVATSFEHRPYGMELAMCQRYYEAGSVRFRSYSSSGSAFGYSHGFNANKRTTPTITFSGTAYGSASGITSENVTQQAFGVYALASAAVNATFVSDFTASAEL